MLSKTTTEEDYFILTHDTEHERRKKTFFLLVLLESIYQTISYITGDKLFEHIKDRQPNTARYVSQLHKRYLMSFRQKINQVIMR